MVHQTVLGCAEMSRFTLDLDTRYAEVLVLAALTYRGFADNHSVDIQNAFVGQAISNGLATLSPVRGQWDLVWGPATSRAGGLVDSAVMFVVRNAQNRDRYVVAVRGTNPISVHDWTYGDLNVATLVEWPFAKDGAALSTSTASGLRTLLQMEWTPPGPAAQAEAKTHGVVGTLKDEATRTLEAIVRSGSKMRLPLLRRLAAPIESVFMSAFADGAATADVPALMGRVLARNVTVTPSELLPPGGEQHQANGTTLFDFLRTRAEESDRPIDVTVTGHSKGGALAPALALWLTETRSSPAPNGVHWDRHEGPPVRCVSFAGPTPGNADFSFRIDSKLGDVHDRVINTNDIVPHAWERDSLLMIPELYDRRSAPLRPLVDEIASGTAALRYRHAESGHISFAGGLDDDRSFIHEFIYQHLDAYIERFGLSSEMDALTFFLG
jgi:lipase (class 3)